MLTNPLLKTYISEIVIHSKKTQTLSNKRVNIAKQFPIDVNRVWLHQDARKLAALTLIFTAKAVPPGALLRVPAGRVVLLTLMVYSVLFCAQAADLIIQL